MTHPSDRSPFILARAARARAVRITAGTLAVGLVAGTVIASGGGSASAATPNAQSVGRFLDGSVGGMALQSLANLQDARAKAPGSTSVQNPLGATLLGQVSVPLGTALQLPGGGAFNLGAVNQVAVAQTSGYSYGASGAVKNSGGVSLGGTNTYPADAQVDLTSTAAGAALGTVPVPGLPTGTTQTTSTLAALGGITADIGAVSALANTQAGGKFGTPQYQIAGLTLTIGSPALGALLTTLAGASAPLATVLAPIVTAAGGALPSSCAFTPGTVPSTISLDSGAVTISASTGTITVNLGALLSRLGLSLNNLPPNTDLLGYVRANLPTILSSGLASVVNGILNPITAIGTACLPALGPLGVLVSALLPALTSGQSGLETAVTTVATQLGSAGSALPATLTSALPQALAIGANVQQGAFPLSSAATPQYVYASQLAATPDQSTPVVSGQGVVRALEIDIAGSQIASLALASAAAGPYAAPVAAASPTPTATPTPTPSASVAATAIPTGVPAGAAGHSGGNSPAMPIALLLLGLVLAGGGVLSWRMRGKFNH